MPNKNTKRAKEPSGNKRTVQSIDPKGYYKKHPSWRFNRMFLDHKWAINLENWACFENSILPKLKSYESQTWGQIESASKGRGAGSKSHNIDIYKLCPEAQRELQNYNIHIDQIFSLRLSGTERIFGILSDGVLDIVWYDSKHEVCPQRR